MKNKVYEEFSEEKFSRLNNFNIIMSKVKEKKSMRKISILEVAAVFIAVIIIGCVTPTIYAKIQFEIQFKEYQDREFETGLATLKDVTENGYVENIEMDYLTQENIGLKVNSLLMTNSHLEIKLDFKFPDNAEVDSEKFSYGYAIYDENKNIYGVVPREHIDDSEQFVTRTKLLYKDIGVEYNSKDLFAIQLNSGSQIQNVSAQNYNIISKITMDSLKKFPKSKKLFIRIFDLGFYMYDENALYDTDFKVADVEWIFELDIPEKFYDIEIVEMTLKDEIPGVKVNEIIVDDVKMRVNLDIEGFVEYVTKLSKERPEELFDMITISDEEGKVYSHYSGGAYNNNVIRDFEINKNMLDKKLFLNIQLNDIRYTSELILE